MLIAAMSIEGYNEGTRVNIQTVRIIYLVLGDTDLDIVIREDKKKKPFWDPTWKSTLSRNQ